MKKKTLTLIPILLYSGVSSASLYIHQPVENESSSNGTNLNIIYDEKDKIKAEENRRNWKKSVSDSENKSNNKELIVSKNKKEIYKNKEVKSSYKGKEKHISNQEISTPRETISDEVVPYTETIYAKMDEGFLSNSMRKHLESLGWELRWTSGADREITVPYIIEHKDVIGFVQEVSELYNIFIDVYPANKTVHVSK